jgi:hypothetical protein
MEQHGAPHLVNNDYHVGARNALIELAVRFAIRFDKDNERFDPHKFLDACSPDAEQYPLSLLWDDRKELVKGDESKELH